MEKISSFKVNHLNLELGIYISRIDYLKDESITTYDLRMTKPNQELVMKTGVIHAIEHLGASFLRNKIDDVIYFGPMGCRTGFYLIVKGNKKPEALRPLIMEMLQFIIDYQGEIIGASPNECGNYQDMDLDGAKASAKKYYKGLKEATILNFNYPK